MTNKEVFDHAVVNGCIVEHWPVDIDLTGEQCSNCASEALIVISGVWYLVVYEHGVPRVDSQVYRPNEDAFIASKEQVASILGVDYENQDDIDMATADFYDDVAIDELLADYNNFVEWQEKVHERYKDDYNDDLH